MNEHDPVEEFFARERGSIEPLPGGDDRWQEIVGQARARRRPNRSWIGYAAAIAAVASLAGAGGWLARGSLPGNNTTDPLASGSSTISQTSSPSTSSTSSPNTQGTRTQTSTSTSTSTTNPTNLQVPQDFSLMSLSYAGQDTMLAIGSGTCSGPACPAVIKSTDNGATWNLAATLKGADSPGRAALGQVGSDRAFTGIRMANPSVGWIFGGGAMRTTDGGSHWEDFTTQGAAVIDLAATKDGAVLTSVTEGCDGAKCTGDVLIEKAGVGDTSSRELKRIEVDVPIESADVEFSLSGTAIVRIRPVAGSEEKYPGATYAVTGDTVTEIDLACVDSSALYVAASGGERDFALCPAAGEGVWDLAQAPLANGTTPAWAAVDGDQLDLGPGVFTSAATTDAQNLVAATGGRVGEGGLLVSHDGGQTWKAPASAPPLPDRGWRWVASPGATWFYAIPSDGIRGFWRSTDNGETWERVALDAK